MPDPDVVSRHPFVRLTLALALAVCSLALSEVAAAQTPTRVRLQLKWHHQFQFAGYYAAHRKGFYRAEGLEVDIIEGQPSQGPIARVLAGKAEFGISDTGLVLARMSGKPVVALASIFQHSPYVLMSRRDRGLRTPADLIGKRVMLSGDHGEAQLRAIFLREGLSTGALQILPHSWNLQDLVAGRVDAMSAYLTEEPQRMRALGVEPGLIRAVDYGIDFYSDALFTTDQFVADHPDEVAAFRRASLKGWDYAMSHVDEMAGLIATFGGVRERGITEETLRTEAEAMRTLILPDVVELGHMNPGRWERMAQTFVDLGIFKGPYSLQGFIFAPDQADNERLRTVLTWVVGLVAPAAGLGFLWIVQLRRAVASRTAALSGEVAQRREAEARLRVSEERTRMVVQKMPVLLWALDEAQRVVAWNHACEQVTGYTADEILGHPDALATLYPDPEERERIERMWRDTGGLYQNVEWPLTAKDGSRHWVSWTSISPRAPIPGWGFWAIGIDITARRQAEDERARIELKLQQSQKLESLGVLAGGIAHDFNNLLTSVLGNADLALMDLPDDSPIKPSLRQIEVTARRAADLTRQLLAYSGKGRFMIEPVDLSELVREMAHLLEVSVSKRAGLEFVCAPGLPSVEADATQLRQIVMNLILNASESMHGERGTITVSTFVRYCDRAFLASCYLDDGLPEANYVCIEVRDTGAGMQPDVLARIFDPFFTTKFTGRGLGLAAVLGIVRGHRGAIRVVSEPGGGSSFAVFLPASDVRARRAATATGEQGWRGSGLALVVDDEDGVRRVAERMLARMGFEVAAVEGGEQALSFLASHPARPSLVLLDLTMPGMTGEETFAALRQLDASVPIVLSSGFSEQEAVQRFSGDSPEGFVQKPYRYDVLLEHVRTALDPEASSGIESRDAGGARWEKRRGRGTAGLPGSI